MIRSASGSASFFLALRLFPCKASFNGTNSPDDSEESFVSLSSASSNNSWSCSKQFMKSSEFSGASSSNKSLSSESASSDGPNMEKRSSNSSGLSTLLISRMMESREVGIASIISGISSASKPKSIFACSIISRKSSLALSEP